VNEPSAPDGQQPDLPPPIPPAEMAEADLAALIDTGDVAGVARALREQMVRLPAVLRQLDRVLEAGLGNLAAALATMLIADFKVSQANSLAARVLSAQDTAGVDELVDLAAALINQERLKAAADVLAAASAKDPKHDRAGYFSSRLAARSGDVAGAFERIARVNPKVLGSYGLAAQARFALLSGRPKAAAGALKQATKRAAEGDDAAEEIRHAEAIRDRIGRLGIDPTSGFDLRTAMAVEYGCALIELAQDERDGGRFGIEPLVAGDVGRLLKTIAAILEPTFGSIQTLWHATEDGEIVAAGLSQLIGCPYRQWARDTTPTDGDWLCMASAATHPHLPSDTVAALAEALDTGALRTLALVLPAGWRGPIVPDVLGRLTGDDEWPWAFDEEVEDALEMCFEGGPSQDLVRADEALHRDLERFSEVLRAATAAPRPAPVPYLDETPVPRRR